MVNKKAKQKLYLILVIILVALLNSNIVNAVPPMPNEFYGTVQLFNDVASSGVTISVLDSNSNICGTFTMTQTGYYGVLSCNGKDTDGSGTGPVENEELRFKIGGLFASAVDTSSNTSTITPTWHTGEFTNINLVAPALVCGDNYCDLYENCGSCVDDCGVCPAGGGAGGTGTGGGGGGGTTDSSTRPTQSAIPPGIDSTPEEEKPCEAVWLCSDWSDCFSNNLKFRDCEDINACELYNETPSLEEDCEYIEIQPENITFANITTRPREEIPGVIATCQERMGLLSLPSLIFIILFILLIIISYVNLKRKIKEIKSDKELEDIEKLKLEFRAKRETKIFMIIVFLLSIIVYFYHYFFFLCKDKYINHLWLLALLIALSPIVINAIIEILKYRDSVHLAKYKLFKDAHYQHFLKMLDITNNHLLEIENKIVNSMNSLESSDDFNTLISNVPELQNIYKDLEKLFALYKHHKDAINVEKDLNENISNLSKKDTFNNAAKEHPELERLKNDLDILFKTYKTKQEIYTEINKLEKAYLEAEEEIETLSKKENASQDKDSENKKDEITNKDTSDSKEQGDVKESEQNQNNKEKEKSADETEKENSNNNKEKPQEKPVENTNKKEEEKKNMNEEKKEDSFSKNIVTETQKNNETTNEEIKTTKPSEEINVKPEKITTEQEIKKEQEPSSEVNKLSEISDEPKTNVLDINSSENEAFFVRNGPKLLCLRELKEYIKDMSDETFNHHVNSERNDFANWTKGALKLDNEAEKIRKSRNKMELSNILDTL